MTISRNPQRISKEAWYYETPHSLELFVYCPTRRVGIVREVVPARRLLVSLARMGLIPARYVKGKTRKKGKC